MHVRNVELLEVVVAVERPVCVDEILTRSVRIAAELIERHPADSCFYRRNPFLERDCRIQPREQQRSPFSEWQSRQIVRCARKTLGAVELRHRHERPVHCEAAAVIAAADGLEVSLAFDDQRATMSAHIRETAQLRGFIRDENERLVEASLEKRERKHVARSFYARGVAGPLPAPRKDRVLL